MIESGDHTYYWQAANGFGIAGRLPIQVKQPGIIFKVPFSHNFPKIKMQFKNFF